ncbi:C-type lectin lectoxin-Lio3-like [Homarus americanus]|uniref:Collectin-12-like 3 n=1 Tax=Homarus americanus TaxID=6706 RepID=A0A8J5J8D8_HOMAM|nr:C-type lectin lectoxin-Lio3-like [Homarus americanus]XP_042235299.1 C-type lectin lectoxin-Lio3-like [Homarus americanus]KAG7154141.1 Collectin-12-like 4 [Homarus americanus]KAG7176489.1 Collectin-12-like 3 [Homarus americanus]
MLGRWILPALVVMGILQGHTVRAKPGTFFTTGSITDKWLPTGIIASFTAISTKTECESVCSKNLECNGYAINILEKKCVLYNVKPGGTKPVQYNGYNLYILKRTEEDGYYVYGTDYIKLMIERQTPVIASKICAQDGGHLVSVNNKKLNNMLYNMMVKHNIWTAIIGVSDLESEGDWKYADGSSLSYTNWDWNGFWPRKDLDCAVITITPEGSWRHASCWTLDYYFCQIPMF